MAPLIDYTTAIVIAGSGTVGFVSGMMGTFSVLRRQSLLGDAISHAALPGIAIAFLITHTKNPFALLLGAMISGWISSSLVLGIVRRSIIKADAAMGIVLSVFFGLGLMLLTIIQRMGTSNQSGLSHYLFGNASTLLKSELIWMMAFGLIACLGTALFWKEFKLLAFDREFGDAIGFQMTRIEWVLSTLTVIGIVIGIQTVGVILMSALLVAPAAAARQWSRTMSQMVQLSAGIGAGCAMIGAWLSAQIPKLPTGPTIVLCLTVVVAVSLLFAPKRGLIWEWIRHQ